MNPLSKNQNIIFYTIACILTILFIIAKMTFIGATPKCNTFLTSHLKAEQGQCLVIDSNGDIVKPSTEVLKNGHGAY